MKPSLWHRMDVLARQLTPFGLTLVLVVIGVVPFHIPGFARVVPLLPLMAIYHWAIFRPELMPSYAVFVIGILQDTLTGAPIGVNAMVFLIVYGVVLSQQRFFVGKSFAIIWLGFALVAAGAAAVSWVLVSAYNVTLVEPSAVLFQYLVTLGAFPLLAWLFTRWQQTFLKQE
jgi:rod shape-determining protein MreD